MQISLPDGTETAMSGVSETNASDGILLTLAVTGAGKLLLPDPTSTAKIFDISLTIAAKEQF